MNISRTYKTLKFRFSVLSKRNNVLFQCIVEAR